VLNGGEGKVNQKNEKKVKLRNLVFVGLCVWGMFFPIYANKAEPILGIPCMVFWAYVVSLCCSLVLNICYRKGV